ncbi:MAG: hypothetical protein C0467_20850 [Planctomycetaceae bacterium]|nr:hypothetical protein [Planctomycetaceae bacterium]
MIALMRFVCFTSCVILLLTSALGNAQKPEPSISESVKAEDADQILLDLITTADGFNDKAFARGEYKHVRTAFSRYFEAKHGPSLKARLGADAAPVFEFLAENAEVRETLFTAIDPVDDDPAAVMSVFRDLWKADSDAVKKNDELAVAISVVWDNPRGSYDYRQHQSRTRSTLPDGVMKIGPIENFRYALDRQAKLKGPQQQVPWEFLVHTVNHRTPIDERDWAATNYLKRRISIGTCYKDIEYDNVMLQTQSKVCKLNDKAYTLANIKQFGGVCAMQADFAARVAKSIGVPAEYITGEANSGALHAWVMWAEVKAVNKDAVTFTLESYGRYNLDHYYVGTLTDPKSGKTITDRDLERRLTAVGNSPQNSRQADLLMRAYPIIRSNKELTAKQQATYLNRVLALYPMCGAAWQEFAALYKAGTLTSSQDATALVNKAVNTFVKFPDFSWSITDDLLTPQKDKLTRTGVFVRLVASYELLGRPDLACQGRLKLVEYLIDAKDFKPAFDGLAYTVRKFPDEGRYIPKMITRMQEVAKDIKGGDNLMAKFYLEILPKVPVRRGDMVSDYCVKLHEQALAYLKDANHPKEAAIVEQSLARVKAGKAP